jgi:DNA-binding transcriptional LysR family regulator
LRPSAMCPQPCSHCRLCGTKDVRIAMLFARELARAGRRVALGSKALASEHLAAGRLVRPFKLSLVTDFAYYVVCAKARAEEPDLVAFRRWLLAEAQREPVAHRGSRSAASSD